MHPCAQNPLLSQPPAGQGSRMQSPQVRRLWLLERCRDLSHVTPPRDISIVGPSFGQRREIMPCEELEEGRVDKLRAPATGPATTVLQDPCGVTMKN